MPTKRATAGAGKAKPTPKELAKKYANTRWTGDTDFAKVGRAISATDFLAGWAARGRRIVTPARKRKGGGKR